MIPPGVFLLAARFLKTLSRAILRIFPLEERT
jgi:hypothetical protein